MTQSGPFPLPGSPSKRIRARRLAATSNALSSLDDFDDLFVAPPSQGRSCVHERSADEGRRRGRGRAHAVADVLQSDIIEEAVGRAFERLTAETSVDRRHALELEDE